MKIKAVSGIMLTLLLIGMLLLAFSIQTIDPHARAHTIDVPIDYPTIQEAINAASLGDTIYVKAGTYYEHVVVNKTVSLIGENWDTTIIDGSGTGTVVHVKANNIIINGFTIQNGGTTYPYFGRGILVDRSNGNNISRNIIANNYYGIFLLFSHNNTLSGNMVSSNSHDGISLYNSSNNTLRDNKASSNAFHGISLHDSSNNVLTGNIASSNSWSGIRLYDSGNNILMGNNASNNQYNFDVEGEFNNYVDVSNTVDGKPIYYLIGATNAVYDIQSNAGTIYLVNCNNITIRDLTLTKNWNGVFFWNTTNSKIENTTTSKNHYGIGLSHSSNNTLSGNDVSNNHDGIWLYYSSNNTVTNNTVSSSGLSARGGFGIWLSYSSNNKLTGNTVSSNNYGVGVFLRASGSNILVGSNILNNWQGITVGMGSKSNTIYHNNFINNTQQVFSRYTTSTWDDGYPSGGNYWSDYTGVDLYSGPYQDETGSDGIGDTAYVIDDNNEDNYPLVNPWTPAPPTVVAIVDVVPKTLNLKSKGKWITCYIELPEGYDVSDIDVSKVTLNNTISVSLLDVPAPKPVPTEIGDYDNDGIPDLMVKFNRTMISEVILSKSITYGNVTLTITGEIDGTPFEGSDSIRVLFPSTGRTGRKR